MFKKLGTFFLQGVLFTVPIAVTIYVIFALLGFIDDILPTLLPVEIRIPGLGLLILVVAITAIGFLGNTVVATPINYWFNRLLDKAPVIKMIYGAIVDFTEAIVGGKKSKFSQPVRVKFNDSIERLGFITQDELSGLDIESDKVLVYFPHSYGFTGNICIVPKSNVTRLNIKSAELMKMILSGGVSESSSDK